MKPLKKKSKRKQDEPFDYLAEFGFGQEPQRKGRKRNQEPTLAQEYYASAQNIYSMYKSVKDSPLAHLIKRKWKERKERKQAERELKNLQIFGQNVRNIKLQEIIPPLKNLK